MKKAGGGVVGQHPTARRGEGARSREAILDQAARLATVEGLSGLSLSRLADAVGLSKSGLFSHFGSKEELQLETIETAQRLFDGAVTEPAAGAAGGIGRLRALVDGYLRYLEVETFPGGCFFASALAEVDMQPGPVRDRLVAFLEGWLGRLEAAITDAQREGSIDPTEDAGQLTFEIEAFLLLANAQYVVARTPDPLERARRAIERRLAPPATVQSYGRRRPGVMRGSTARRAATRLTESVAELLDRRG